MGRLIGLARLAQFVLKCEIDNLRGRSNPTLRPPSPTDTSDHAASAAVSPVALRAFGSTATELDSTWKTETSSAGPHPLRGRDWLLILLTIAPFVALAILALVDVGHGYLGANDNGMTELRIRDIGSSWPLIGPFSREGWSHPGPLVFYVLAIAFRATGSRSNGLLVGAAIINGASAAAMIALARRWGGTALAVLMALGVAIVTLRLGPAFLWDPWNPFVTVLPFGLLVLATWAVTCGDRWCLPVVAAVGTFCAQTHVLYAPLVATMAAVCIGGLVIAARQRRLHAITGPPLRGAVLTALGILALLWLPPAVQQLTTNPGNLWKIGGYFLHHQAAHSLRDGYHVVATQFSAKPNWIVGMRPVNPYTGETGAISTSPFPVWWLAAAAALVAAWRLRYATARRLGVVLAIVTAASVVAVAHTVGPVVEYRLGFVVILGMLTAVFTVWVLATWLARRTSQLAHRAATATVVVVVIALSLHTTAIAPDATRPNQAQGRIAATLAKPLPRRLPHRPGVVVVSVRGPVAGPLITGIMLDLERHGIPVAMHDNLDDRLRFGANRMLRDRPVRAEIRVVTDRQIETIAAMPCTRELAYWGQSPRRARTRALATVSRIERDFANGAITAREALVGIGAETRYFPAAAVYLMPSSDSTAESSC